MCAGYAQVTLFELRWSYYTGCISTAKENLQNNPTRNPAASAAWNTCKESFLEPIEFLHSPLFGLHSEVSFGKAGLVSIISEGACLFRADEDLL